MIVCVRVRLCLHAYACVRENGCLHELFLCVHYRNVRICACVRACVHVCVRAYVCVFVLVFVRARVCVLCECMYIDFFYRVSLQHGTSVFVCVCV